MNHKPRCVSPRWGTLISALVVIFSSVVVLGINLGTNSQPSSKNGTPASNSILTRERVAPNVTITCPKCEGTGSLFPPGSNPLTGVQCSLCKGKGKLSFPRNNPPCCHGSGICSMCQGKGKVADGNGHIIPCRACQGTGLCGGWVYDKKAGLISRPCLMNR